MKKIDNKTIYERLWTGRDFEITHLWQRSVFLATFIVMIFTAYCGLWAALIGMDGDKDGNDIHIEYRETVIESSGIFDMKGSKSEGVLTSLSSHSNISIGFIILAFTGSIFSLLWIFMTKGSKYWYEKYESSINYMHNRESDSLFSEDVKKCWRVEDIYSAIEWRLPCHVPVQSHLKASAKNQSIYSQEGAAYSMSKVNIAIGQFFFLLWILLLWIHVAIFLDAKNCFTIMNPYVTSFLFVVGGMIIIVMILKRLIAGGEFENNDYGNWIYFWHRIQRYLDESHQYMSLINDYKAFKKTVGNRFNNSVYTMEVAYLDSKVENLSNWKLYTIRHLSYLDVYRMKLFLSEFAEPLKFPLSTFLELSDCDKASNAGFPITKSVFNGFVEKYIKLDDGYDLRCFAEPHECQQMDDIYTSRHMLCVAVDSYGKVLGSVLFFYHAVKPYNYVMEYSIIGAQGNIEKTGKLKRI